jgi:hypothetical protein
MYIKFGTSIFDQGMRFFDLMQKQTGGRFERVEFSVAAILGVVPAITDLELQVITELFGDMNPGGGGAAASAAGGAGGPSGPSPGGGASSVPVLSASNLTASMMENARIAALAPPGLSERNRAAFLRAKGKGYSYHPAVPNPNGGETVYSKTPLTSSGVRRRSTRRRLNRKKRYSTRRH